MFDFFAIIKYGKFEDKILGRKTEEYLEREFSAVEHVFVPDVRPSDIPADKPVVVLDADAPLVRLADLTRIAAKMKRKGITTLSFGDNFEGIYLSGYAASDTEIHPDEFCKLDSAKSYNIVYNILKGRIIERHLSAGVFIPSSDTVFIDDTVTLHKGSKVLPFSRIIGDSEIYGTVEASYVENSRIDEGAVCAYSHIVDSRVGARTSVGPFARLRGATVGEDCRIGDFVEIKKSIIGGGTKSAHLTYIGDAEIGKKTNVGCGTVFCNYDGKNKHRTKVGDGCFIGANVNLVAPLEIGDNSFVGAGTTVTDSIDENTFTIGRVRASTRKKE